MSPSSVTRGVHHVGLTVTDLARAQSFFIDTLGFKKVGEKPEYPAAFVSDGTSMITLWQIKEENASVAFNRHHNVGLHHLALAVDDGELDALHTRLRDIADCTIEFAPEAVGASGSRHMMVLIPAGGVRVEFFGIKSK